MITRGPKKRPYTLSELKAITNAFIRCERPVYYLRVQGPPNQCYLANVI